METHVIRKNKFTTLMPFMSIMLGLPPNPFNPFAFGMTHIPQFLLLIMSGYMPSTRYPIHIMLAPSRFGVFGGPLPQSEGYNSSHSFNPGRINMLG